MPSCGCITGIPHCAAVPTHALTASSCLTAGALCPTPPPPPPPPPDLSSDVRMRSCAATRPPELCLCLHAHAQQWRALFHGIGKDWMESVQVGRQGRGVRGCGLAGLEGVQGGRHMGEQCAGGRATHPQDTRACKRYSHAPVINTATHLLLPACACSQLVFDYFCERTPRSSVEVRETSLVWNYKYAGA